MLVRMSGTPADAASGRKGQQAVFLKWRNQPVMRTFVTPTQPRTAAQQNIRAIMSTLSRRWRDVLTDGERATWKTWAQDHPITNRLGVKVVPTSLGAYLGINSTLMLMNQNDVTTTQSSAPTLSVAPVGNFAGFAVHVTAGGSTPVDIDYVGADFANFVCEIRMRKIGKRQVQPLIKRCHLECSQVQESFLALTSSGINNLSLDSPIDTLVLSDRITFACTLVDATYGVSYTVFCNNLVVVA